MAILTPDIVREQIDDFPGSSLVSSNLSETLRNKLLYEVFNQLENGTSRFGVGNSPEYNIDSGGRIRVAQGFNIFDSQFQYNLYPLIWDDISTGVGTNSSTHLPNESAVRLQVDATNGSGRKLRTRRYYRYQPGKSQLVQMTFVFGEPAENLYRAVGQYDDDDGIMLIQKGTTGLFVRNRTSVSGSPDDSREFIQSQWNMDTLDGSGSENNPSGKRLDLAKAQFLFFDYQWFSIGLIRIGFKVDDRFIYAHQFFNANVLTGPYAKSMNKPLTYEILNVGATSGINTLKAICSSIISEGGAEQKGIRFSSGTGPTARVIAAGSIQPVFAIRPKLLFNSITNRSLSTLREFSITSDKNVYYRVSHFKARSTITGGAWSDVQASNSAIEINTTVTAEGTPEVIKEQGVIPATNQSRVGLSNNTDPDILSLSLNAAGNDSDVIVVSAQNLDAGSANVYSHLRWIEEK